MRFFFLLLFGLSRLTAADAARDARWRQDLDTLSLQLPALHPNLFFHTPRSVFDGAVNDLRSAIPDLSDTEVMVGLSHIVALPADGHTNLALTQRNSTFRLLPLQLRWFEDGLFVTAAGQSYVRAVGARVVQIGEPPLEQAYQAVAGIVSHENDSWVRDQSPNYFINADVLHALGIAASTASVPFVLEDLAGTRFTLDIASLDPAQSVKGTFAPNPATGFTPYYQQHTDQNYWFTYIESSRTLYFAYNLCANQAGLPFAQFNSQLWATFDAQPVERFVLDLRNNSGGDSSVLDPFVIAGMARAQAFFNVRPVVIIGRHTYSAAITNAIALRQGPVILVGEPSGGSPNTYTEVKTFVLPNSQLIVRYSTKYNSYPNYPTGPMLPDVAVPIYSSDWFARHDPFLAVALADAGPGATRSLTAGFGAQANPLADGRGSDRSPDRQGGVAPNSTASHGHSTSPPKPGAVTVVSAANFRKDMPVAPGSLAAAFGDFSGVTDWNAPAIPLVKQIGGVQVLVNGVAAPLLAVRANQINFQMPAATVPGTATVRVQRNGNDLAAGTAQIAVASPGLFADVLNLARPGAVLDENSRPVSDASPARRGSVIQIYATGQGGTLPAVEDGAAGPAASQLTPRVYFGDEQAEVLFSGLQPAFPGLWQINVRVPDVAVLSGQTPVFVVAGSSASNPVTVAVN
jgi:uncharacterized protein (TIGR03437 family)